jgi:hypothetical protein
MTSEEWTEAYENAWKSFYSKENMIRNLSRWADRPKNYWNLMSIYFWYKNAALIEKQHPMIAGFFRLKDRTSRRPGYPIDPLPVHLWKRAKEITRLLITWARFLKEMEEVWLQTRKKSETEERWLEHLERIQTDVWQALRIREIQQIYNSAKETLPERVKPLLEPLEELSSRVLLTRSDLNEFLKQWQKLRDKIQELRAGQSENARRWLDEIHHIQSTIRLGGRIHEWQEGYARLRQHLPARARWYAGLIKFDAANNRFFYSRREVQRIWSETIDGLRSLKLWQIRPWKLARAMFNDFSLTTWFAVNFREFSKHPSEFNPS